MTIHTKPEIEIVKATEQFREAVDLLLKSRGIAVFGGPPMAYFVRAEDEKRFEYISFSVCGRKEQGASGGSESTVEEAISKTLEHFGAWLIPTMPLAWRNLPEMHGINNKWTTYLRCVQLDRAGPLIIEWPTN